MPKLKIMLFGGVKVEKWLLVPDDKKAQNRVICGCTDCIPLHAATATECDKITKGEYRLLKF